MRRLSLIIFIGLLVLLAAYVVLERTALVQQVVLWIVGLAGFLWVGVKKVAGWLTGSDALDEIEAKNRKLEEEVARLRIAHQEAKAKLEQERVAHRREAARLQQALDALQAEQAGLAGRRAALEEMDYKEYRDSLSEEQRMRLDDRIWSHITAEY